MDLYDLGGWCLIYKLEELFIITVNARFTAPGAYLKI